MGEVLNVYVKPSLTRGNMYIMPFRFYIFVTKMITSSSLRFFILGPLKFTFGIYEYILYIVYF